MKKVEIEELNKKVEKPYEWVRRSIEDYAGNKFNYIQIHLIEKENCYWAMNTDNNINGNWAIKKGSDCIERVTGLDKAIAKLLELN